MKKPFFISTAIDYPSEPPHLGHALEKIQADVLARYKRAQGFDVHFSTGTDEHGLKIQRRAEKAGKKPREFVDEMSKYFKEIWKSLNISFDDFIRTTERRHEKIVKEIVKKIYEKGDIYKGKYKGLYCVDCESYYLPKDLKNGKCPVHFKKPELIEEETYFFRMKKYQGSLLKHIKENKNFIIPESKRIEILKRLEKPLQDLSITRAKVKWGTPFPFDKNLTLFVWIDALINYLTTIDYPNENFKKFWPADVHVIGKDIVWHHSVIWSSLLMSLDLPLPKTIFVHGFITVSGQKMSKSLGNVINPQDLVKRYGSDPIRYFLLREGSPFEDIDFTFEKFEKRYNFDLANELGNLTMRIVTLAKKARVKEEDIFKDKRIKSKISKTKKEVKNQIESFKFNEALNSIWDLISFTNSYIDKTRPWEKGKEEIIRNLILVLREVAKIINPFLPLTSQRILEQIKLRKPEILFPKIKKE